MCFAAKFQSFDLYHLNFADWIKIKTLSQRYSLDLAAFALSSFHSECLGQFSILCFGGILERAHYFSIPQNIMKNWSSVSRNCVERFSYKKATRKTTIKVISLTNQQSIYIFSHIFKNLIMFINYYRYLFMPITILLYLETKYYYANMDNA